MTLILLALYDKFGQFWFTEQKRTCVDDTSVSLISNFILIITIVYYFVKYTVYFLQVFEWIVMLHIVFYQRGKTIEEITFNTNNTIETFGRKNNYKSREKLMRLGFVLVLVGAYYLIIKGSLM